MRSQTERERGRNGMIATVLVQCSRSPHDQNVLARRPQLEQHGHHLPGQRGREEIS